MSEWTARYFKRDDIECPCGCGASSIYPGVMELADAVRAALGVPLRVGSGVRCRAHNAAVEGRPGSLHLPQSDGMGYAVDLSYYRASDKSPVNVARLYITLEDHSRRYGACGLGLYDWGCHVDLRGSTPAPRAAARWQAFPWPLLKK